MGFSVARIKLIDNYLVLHMADVEIDPTPA